MSISVQFHQDLSVPKWTVFVTGANSEVEAIQAFTGLAKELDMMINFDKLIAKNIGFNIFQIEENSNG